MIFQTSLNTRAGKPPEDGDWPHEAELVLLTESDHIKRHASK